MTTAARATSPNGIWCFPTGMPWVKGAQLCSRVFTRGSFLISTTFEGTSSSNLLTTIITSAMAVLLMGQTSSIPVITEVLSGSSSNGSKKLTHRHLFAEARIRRHPEHKQGQGGYICKKEGRARGSRTWNFRVGNGPVG
ncbi:hypothetical protein F5Y11DRAFT_302533 [Daldinia sp. FL1419]|nr:hypothetical protein F5Y11DRAFT_302533 [Daldinia sp. FL1419]